MGDHASRPYRIEDLLRVMARLRDPDTGCPAAREIVTRRCAAIAPYTIEEAYEVVDAIGRGDLDALKDEFGDLLLQVVYHGRLAEEAGAFDLSPRRSSAAIRTCSRMRATATGF